MAISISCHHGLFLDLRFGGEALSCATDHIHVDLGDGAEAASLDEDGTLCTTPPTAAGLPRRAEDGGATEA